jgi:hemerythrin-like domain-containing protein
MKRDERLQPLSRDHHQGLVLALRIKKAAEAGDIDDEMVASARDKFAREIEPHFSQEENWLLPALEEVGESNFVSRILGEHRELRTLLDQAEQDSEKLEEFGKLLKQHIRFEEREVFERAQDVLSEETLDRLAPHFHAYHDD